MRAGIVALAALALASSFAGAQLRDCPSVAVADGSYKVVLDDITWDATGAASQAAMDRLQFQLEANLDQLKTELGVPLSVVRCEKRQPRDGDFTPEIVRALSGFDVLVEIWGTTSEGRDAAGKPSAEAFVRYALIPVQRAGAEFATWPGTWRSNLRSGSGTELVDLLASARDLQAVAAISAAVKALRVRDFDRAIRFLCRGDALLAAPGPLATSPSREKALALVRGLAQDTVKQARGDASYKGALRVLTPAQAERPCTGGAQ